MANKETNIFPKPYAMIGGDGQNSYVKNSGYQKGVVDSAKEMMNEAIADKLDFKTLGLLDSSSCTFQIVDFGCSVGPNTFTAMQNIIESVDKKYHSQVLQQHQNSSLTLEFQAIFNDHYNNDFNTLFANLPPLRKYFAAGVPGSFHGRLFPKSTLHFAHCSYALHWLCKIPREIMDNTSPAWNKDSIQCTGIVKEVAEAYLAQYKNDMESFFNARAQELVAGGLMVILLSVRPNGIPMFMTGEGKVYDLLGTCLVDLAKKGLLSEEKVNSFNLPIYYPTMKELEDLVQNNGYFTIERMNKLSIPMTQMTFSPQLICSMIRSVFEGVIKEHFGEEFIDHIFNHFTTKLAENLIIFKEKDPHRTELFILLKRLNID
ncbi:hypothetical protein Q3G72_031038 [Acer saccharum]|nr:hypothetical protein Q3G72_031038 [Acer saccharum]